ncbi:MAG: pyridoxal phosphate-dependent aminotransferase [Lachnospiraceae bacterium]|nr:pyridoxal phosphate-dependent aminotransferase [Lachnospiraceae bacterium]
MLSQKYKDMCNTPSVIRSLAVYASERGKEIGYENVFDYSLGNPSVPVPEEFNKAIRELTETLSSNELHGYSPNPGNPGVRTAIAESLKKRFGLPYEQKHIFMTSAAASAIAHAVRCVTAPGDEVLTFAPHFPEYVPYINETGAVLKVVPADTGSFQINFDEFEKMLNPKVQAVLINTPNNPSGVAYSSATLKRLADTLYEKQKEYGHEIFLISDEPYREIVFKGADAPYVSSFYDNTLSCYSFSKSLSVPGERIGYVAVNPAAKDADMIVPMCVQISRGTGHNCPSSIIQMAAARCAYLTSDLSVYETNMNLIYDKLIELGFTVVKPGGTFYIFPKALEEDSQAFCEKAKKYDLILVPGDSFKAKGFFRMAYCIDTEKVKRSLPVLEKFVKEEYGR